MAMASSADPEQPSVLAQKFRDLDERSNFNSYLKNLSKQETRNFVVDFSDAKACCASDLSESEIKCLLESPKAAGTETRWINFWGGHSQRQSIEVIVNHYGLAPRLISLLCSQASDKHTKVRPKPKDEGQDGSKSPTVPRKSGLFSRDAEKTAESDMDDVATTTKRPPLDLQKTTFGEIADDIWHFCSVDWGQGYLHVGYNSLFSIPEFEVNSGFDKPTGKRVWTSLILCYDGTVISVSEALPSSQVYPEILRVVRRNTINVFRHLSKFSKTLDAQNELMVVKVRNFDAEPRTDHVSSPMGAAGILFYYIFDDWISSFSLASQNEHPYGHELERLRREMLQKADVRLVKSLHQIGRQIAVLKRIYQSYELIINRIIERQRLLPATLGEKDNASRNADGLLHQDVNQFESTSKTSSSEIPQNRSSPIGVNLGEQAIFRFERLLDRIRLYALSRLDEYIAEKGTLVSMNFNLIALKDSQATEKLTRVTVLLSKIAAVFLPLSLMTSYMSTQIPALTSGYTAKTYWLTFLVVVILSFVFLVVFGLVSDTVEGRTIYKSLTRIAWTRWRTTKRKKLPSKAV